MSENPFFKKFSEQYSRSKSHKYGDDLKILSGMILEGNNLCLDIATGTGFTAAELAKKCKKVYAIDQTKAMLDKAEDYIKSLGIKNVEFININFEDFDFNLKFDLITIRRALHHFRDKDLFFSKSAQLLNSGGIIIISDMLSPPQDDNDIFNEMERIRDSTHQAALKEEEYYNYFKKYGFAVSQKEVTTEKLSFKDWLYPIDENSETAKRCIDFLNKQNQETLNAIRFDLHNMVLYKSRIIIKGLMINSE